MAADYARIRDENVARYGWDTAVLDLLGHLYSERTHFIFELIQNAEDAGAASLAFSLHEDRLELAHDGHPFTEQDVRSICGVARTSKNSDLAAIGKFGIGFKAVYAYTQTPRIHSGGEHFRIDHYVRPTAIDTAAIDTAAIDTAALAGQGQGTLFIFPFDHPDIAPRQAAAEIGAALTALDPAILLFLRNITRLTAGDTVLTRGTILTRDTSPGPGDSTRVTLAGHQDWLVWHRHPAQFPAHRVEVAFRIANGQVIPITPAPLSVFLPTQKETFLGFALNGPFRTTPARDNIGEHDPANQALSREAAALLRHALLQLRDADLIAGALSALPLSAERSHPDSVFRPLFDAAKDALNTESLIPVTAGGYQPATRIVLAEDHGLFTPAQLSDVLNAEGPVFFADPGLPAPVRGYLRDELGVAELSPRDLAAALTADFLAGQDDAWIARLYAFLHAHAAAIAAGLPVIRLQDGSQVRPAGVFLPRAGTGGSRFRTIKRSLASDPGAREFLVRTLGMTEPDIADEVAQVVLPSYDLVDAASLDTGQHDADLELIMRALEEAAPGRHEELLGLVRETAFLIGENAANGEQRLRRPGELYQRGKDLETYFGGNPDAWFAADRYGPWLRQLAACGVRDAVAVTARRPGSGGHVPIADGFARHERGLDGFDPDAEIDGLSFALRNPSHERSEVVWNVVLAPHRRLVAGVVEKSVRDAFVDSARETVMSAAGTLAASMAWLPAPDGRFRKPAELSLEDLPASFGRDEALARALGMSRPVVAEAARQLGIPAAVLWGLSTRPDLVERIERELR